MIDTLAFAKKLEASGTPKNQAEAIAEGVAEFTRDTLVTKGDLSEAKTEIKAEITLLKWMVGFSMGLSLLILGKLFLPHP